MTQELFYIKLGSGSMWAAECLKAGIIRIGWQDIPQEMFKVERLDDMWDKHLADTGSKRTASMYYSQLKSFFEADEKTIWITFHDQKMWWCNATKGYEFGKANTKHKNVIGAWSDKDVNGNTLWEDNLSGALLKTKGYQSTLCVPSAAEYALNKIQCKQSEALVQFEKDYAILKQSTIGLVKKLRWQDFEILVDLIFRNAGFQRLGGVGGTAKTIDLSLSHPLTNEKILVQIKSDTNLDVYNDWKTNVQINEDADTKYYFASHSPRKDLVSYTEPDDTNFTLWREKEIGEMVLRFGLVDWLVQKVG